METETWLSGKDVEEFWEAVIESSYSLLLSEDKGN
jgi:hypothetical protein